MMIGIGCAPGFLAFLRRPGGGGTPVLTAPVLTLTSGTANPPVVTRDIPANAGEGDHIQRRIDTAATYDTGNLREEERILLWDGTDFVLADPVSFEPAPFTIQNDLPTGVPLWMSERFRRDLGDTDLYSNWSDDVTFTLDVPPAETASSWATTTGANKSQWLTVGGTGNLAATGQAGFDSSPCSVRATQARTGKRQFQVAIAGALTSRVHIGLDDGSDHFGDTGTTNFSRPGKDNAGGVNLMLYGFGWEIDAGGGSVQSNSSPVLSDGDVLTCEFDTDAETVSFYLTHSGSTTQIGTTLTGISLSSWYANCAAENAFTLTAKFDSGQEHALSSGYVPYDNL